MQIVLTFQYYSAVFGKPLSSPLWIHCLGNGCEKVQRYMSGKHVERRAGWDCHGLPVEYEIDQKLNGFKQFLLHEKLGIKYNHQVCVFPLTSSFASS